MHSEQTVGGRPANVADRPLTILLVDDVELFLELEHTFFRRRHVDLLVARNGHEALELIVREQPDLVFLDLDLPGINGDEVCRRVRRDVTHRQLPIVMVLPAESAGAEQRCREAGCTEVLQRPVRRDALVALAARHLPLAERRSPRVDAGLMIRFGLQPRKYLENYSVNISASGLYLATGALLTVGTQLDLEFQLPESAEAIRCTGRVAWVNHPDWLKKPKLPVGMGIAFVAVAAQDVALLQRFVDRQRSAN